MSDGPDCRTDPATPGLLNIIMEVPQKILIYTFSVALSYNGISIIIFLKAPDLECIFRGNWS